MKIEYVSTDSIKPYENNPRKISEDAILAVESSLREFGFQHPLVIDQKGVLIAGHTRLLAAQRLGMKEVPCVRPTGLTQKQIDAFRIIDNKSAELSSWDFDLLEVELKKLDLSQEVINMNFTVTELDALITGDDDLANDSDPKGASPRKKGGKSIRFTKEQYFDLSKALDLVRGSEEIDDASCVMELARFYLEKKFEEARDI